MLKAVPAVWAVTVPELPLPEVNVWPGRVTIILAVAPTTSVSEPQLASVGLVKTLVLPLVVMFPLASGVPAVGRTWMFWKRMVLAVTLTAVIAAVMVEPLAATVALNVPFKATSLMLLPAVALPAVIFTVTVAFVLKMKPLGAVRTMLPA